jgi:hypothetical protein
MMAALRLMALIEFRQQLASEHHPQRLLEGFCKAARKLIEARLAITGFLAKIHTPCCTLRSTVYPLTNNRSWFHRHPGRFFSVGFWTHRVRCDYMLPMTPYKRSTFCR